MSAPTPLLRDRADVADERTVGYEARSGSFRQVGLTAFERRRGRPLGKSIRNIAGLHDVPTWQARNRTIDEQSCDDRRRT